MSIVAGLLNTWLRLVEKPFLARVEDPIRVRRGFERKSRLYFHAPRGTISEARPVAGIPAQWVRARGVAEDAGPLLLYFHGGAFVFGSPGTHRAMLAAFSRFSGLPACLPDYRKAPEHPFPAAVDDVVATYRAVAERPGGVVIGGDSAGGGLALSALLEITRQGLTKPRGCVLFSPLTDLTFSGRSISGNARADALLPADRAEEMVGLYLGDHDPRDPRASPLFGDFTGAPPIWMTAGDTEILLDDTRRLAERLRECGVDVSCVIERDLPHVWPIFHNILPEARTSLRTAAAWIRHL